MHVCVVWVCVCVVCSVCVCVCGCVCVCDLLCVYVCVWLALCVCAYQLYPPWPRLYPVAFQPMDALYTFLASGFPLPALTYLAILESPWVQSQVGVVTFLKKS